MSWLLSVARLRMMVRLWFITPQQRTRQTKSLSRAFYEGHQMHLIPMVSMSVRIHLCEPIMVMALLFVCACKLAICTPTMCSLVGVWTSLFQHIRDSTSPLPLKGLSLRGLRPLLALRRHPRPLRSHRRRLRLRRRLYCPQSPLLPPLAGNCRPRSHNLPCQHPP